MSEQAALDYGLYYYRARMYDPAIGRFTTRDPIGFNGSQNNLYAYAGNDPVMMLDPTGFDAVVYTQAGHIIVGVDDPQSPTGRRYVEFGPQYKVDPNSNVTTILNALRVMIKSVVNGSAPGQVTISPDPPGAMIPLLSVSQDTQQDSRMLQWAADLKEMADKGDLKYDPLQFLPNDTSMNCMSFGGGLFSGR